MMYCLFHEKWSVYPEYVDTPNCVWTTSAPPKDERLIEDFDAPDAEELAQMDANAEELLEDFIADVQE